jgi:hypothetical protein
MKFHHLPGLVVSAGLLLSTAWADEVVMKNGDRVTGTIIKQDGKTITVKTDNFGIVTAPWDKVASLKSDQPVNVVLNGRKDPGRYDGSAHGRGRGARRRAETHERWEPVGRSPPPPYISGAGNPTPMA